LNYAAHDPVARELVVGGHASAMRALRHGVPIVAIPGFAGDQPDVAAAIRRTIRRAAA
jgi:UDP:flavonoid glycosyltransferase YjiC (YdhE family)